MDDPTDAGNLRHLVHRLPQESLAAIRLLYLFGSRARRSEGPLSDCDLAVLLDESADTLAFRLQLGRELARTLSIPRIDLVSLNVAPVELAYVVVAAGTLLYQRDLATRVEYEGDVLGRYGDYLPILRAQREDILRGEHHATRVQWYRAALERTERTLGQIRASQDPATG